MQGDTIGIITYVIILLASVVIHELAHGYTAEYFGDPTARYAGRLTINPLPHLEFFGSFLLPLVLLLSGTGFMIAWAKPVPVNPNNFYNIKRGTIWVSLAGVISNLLLAIIFGLFIRILATTGTLTVGVLAVASKIVILNIVLVIFNLIPLPPLDGSKVLFALLPEKYAYIESLLSKWGFFLLLLFIIFIGPKFFPPAIHFMTHIIVGSGI
ncbi:MAG: site-2 protease family protein [Minisyncoccia bacterium]